MVARSCARCNSIANNSSLSIGGMAGRSSCTSRRLAIKARWRRCRVTLGDGARPSREVGLSQCLGLLIFAALRFWRLTRADETFSEHPIESIQIYAPSSNAFWSTREISVNNWKLWQWMNGASNHCHKDLIISISGFA